MSDIVSCTVPISGSNETLYFKDAALRNELTNVGDYIGFVPPKVIGLQADFENGTFTRLGEAVGLSAGSDFDQFPMYGGRRLCNLADDGTVNAWYGEAGYTEDGSNGQVMVYQPKFYYRVVPLKIEPIATETYPELEGYHLLKARYYISDIPKVGFKVHPAFVNSNGNEIDGIYIATYEGSIFDVSENKYLLYDDMEPDGRGKYTHYVYTKDYDYDKLCSISGVKPAAGASAPRYYTLENIEKLAQNRGARWHTETIKVTAMEQLLFVIEYAMFNCRNTIGYGYHVRTDKSYDRPSPQTGSTQQIYDGSGMSEETHVYISTGSYTYTRSWSGERTQCIRYRGIENEWGGYFHSLNGVNIVHNKNVGLFEPYYCTDFNYAQSKSDDNYISVGFSLPIYPESGYVLYFGWSETCDWLFLPTKIGSPATSALPVGDTYDKLGQYSANGYYNLRHCTDNENYGGGFFHYGSVYSGNESTDGTVRLIFV